MKTALLTPDDAPDPDQVLRNACLSLRETADALRDLTRSATRATGQVRTINDYRRRHGLPPVILQEPQ